MAARGGPGRNGVEPGRNSRRLLGCLTAVLLALAGCSSGDNAPAASPSSEQATASQSSSPSSTQPADIPAKPLTDAELTAIINGVGKSRNLPFPAAHDSTRLRSGAAGGSFPSTKTETTPADCVAFVPQDPFARWADKDINFAEGAMPSVGAQSGPTTTVMVVLRSAEKEAITKADFGYTDDLVSRCGQFDLAYTESGRTSTYGVQLLTAPPLGERQHAFMQVTKPKGPGDSGSVGLRVLKGTLSITLNLAVANLNSEADAKPALDAMAGLARELIDQAAKGSTSASPPAPNSMSPDQMVALFKGMTGPGGEPVSLPQAMVVGPPPGFTPGTSAPPADSSCTFDDESYTSALAGAVYGQGQIQGASKIDYTDFAVVNMPSSMGPPYPFDTRAEHLRGCSSIQEKSFGGSSRPWSPVTALTSTITADSTYAVAYQLSDGTGEWHIRCGARRGTLSVEASSRTASQSGTQAKADALASFFDAVFARAGK